MNRCLIEKQVISLRDAKELSGILGDDAPESLWVWSMIDGYGSWGVVLQSEFSTNPFMHWSCECIPAYTGDELAALLEPHATVDLIPLKVDGKAALAIQGLKEGWVKKEEFKYV